MKQLKCKNCSGTMNEHESKCQWCGTSYFNNNKYEEVLRDEKGKIVQRFVYSATGVEVFNY